MVSGLFIRSRLAARAAVMLGLLSAPILSGCGNAKQPWDTVYLAKGVVTYKSKPIINAEIALFPQNDSIPESIRPRAKTTENGEFVVWTNQPGDGAPAGKYKVTVVHNDVIEKNGVVVTKPNDLPPKYSTVQTTDLVVEIGQNQTDIPPIELK